MIGLIFNEVATRYAQLIDYCERKKRDPFANCALRHMRDITAIAKVFKTSTLILYFIPPYLPPPPLFFISFASITYDLSGV